MSEQTPAGQPSFSAAEHTTSPADDRGRLRSSARSAAAAIPQWPLVTVLLVLAIGLTMAGLGHWRRGSFTIGVAVLLAAFERLVLPTHVAGILAVRRRLLDVALMLVMGGAIVALTLVVPPSRP